MLLRSLTGFSPRTTWKYKSRRTRAAALPPNNIFPPYFPDAHLSDKSFGLRGWKPRPQKNPTPRVTGEWGWKDGWFSDVGLFAATEDLTRHSRYLRATEDEGESTEAEQGGGGGLGDGIKLGIGHGLTSAEHVAISKAGMAGKK